MLATDRDMARLQKEKRYSVPHHHERHSTANTQPRMNAVRLTPAEIRAQNNGGLSRSQSQRVATQSSKQLSEGHVTPPPSPTKEQSAYQTQLARTASQSQRPPTPPRSPRLSHAKTAPTRQDALPIPQPLVSQYRQSMPIEAYRGIAGTPVPTSSRTSSISGSIKAPMKYRGHEITRTGSLSMFQAPQPDIVLNPLSHFSRPRTKYSPPGSYNRQDGNTETYQAQHRRNDTAESAVSSLASRSESPMLRSESPTSSRSVGSRASRQFVIVTEDSLPKAEDKIHTSTEVPVHALSQTQSVQPPKRNRDMKKTASVNFDKAVIADAEKEAKKKRRHTFSWKRSSKIEPKVGSKDDLNTPKEEPVVVEVEKQPSPNAGPPVVEQVRAPTPEDKGKGKAVASDHAPSVIGIKCCDKCGRIKKLQDGKALVNDGKTKEALVVAGSNAYRLVTTSNDMSRSSAVNPSGAANAAQLIMHRQRRPKPEPPVVLSSDHLVKDFAATAASQDVPKVVQRKPVEKVIEPLIRVTRFASLRGIPQEKEIVPQIPALNTNVNSSAAEESSQMKATSTPVDEPLPEFAYDPTDDEDEFVTAPTQPRRYSFESQRSVINVAAPTKPFETQMSAPEVVPQAPEPIDMSKPIVLPAPNLGIHFSRSNLTLRELVVPKGGSTPNLLADVMRAGGDTNEIERGLQESDHIDRMRQKHQSQVSEIMAV